MPGASFEKADNCGRAKGAHAPKDSFPLTSTAVYSGPIVYPIEAPTRTTLPEEKTSVLLLIQ